MGTELVIVALGMLGMGLLVAFLLLAAVRLLPPLRTSALIRRITIGCGVGGLLLLLGLAAYGALRESDGATLALGGGCLLLGVAGIGLLAWGRYAWRLRREPLDGPLCPRCSYNLKGLDDPEACPECGRGLASAGRKLYRPRRRRWATLSGAAVMLLAVVIPVWLRVRERGWAGLVPDEVLVRMVVADVGADSAMMELHTRKRALSGFDALWTRAMMTSVAEEYDRVGSAMFRVGWSRAYELDQPAIDEETRQMVRQWATGSTAGKRFVASWMMQVGGVASPEERRLLLPPLLNDPDFFIQTNAIRALSIDCAWPLDDLLAYSQGQTNPAMLYELGNALGRYTADDRALRRRIEIASDTTNTNASHTATYLMISALRLAADSGDASMLRRLAAANVVTPTARSLSGGTNAAVWYKSLYVPLVDAALGGPIGAGSSQPSDGPSRAVDGVTAAWSRAALVSLCTPGFSLTPPRPIIAEIIDEKIAAAQDPVDIKRLRELRNAVWPGSAPEPEP